jgi:hypothetical protein
MRANFHGVYTSELYSDVFTLTIQPLCRPALIGKEAECVTESVWSLKQSIRGSGDRVVPVSICLDETQVPADDHSTFWFSKFIFFYFCVDVQSGGTSDVKNRKR